MPADLEYMYREILKAVGGADNILALGCCITRLRIVVNDDKKVDVEALRHIRDVAGYFHGGVQHQLIVGPFTADRLAAFFRARHKFYSLEEAAQRQADFAPAQIAVDTEAVVARKYSGHLSRICNHIGNIFLPLIPAYIGGGLILGIGNILGETVLSSHPEVVSFIGALGQGILFYLTALVGYNANKEFGGTPALGVAFAGILNVPQLGNFTFGSLKFTPGQGGILALLVMCWVGSWLERKLQKWVKGHMTMFLIPFLTLLITGPLALFLVQPVAALGCGSIANFTLFLLNKSALLAGAFLGGTFLPLVMLGLHFSLIPIHQQLLDTLGNNPLFPILTMAGAGQVGAGLAVLFKARSEHFKKLAKNALPVGVLGAGEPLIYGVTVPLFKPFIAACIGGAVGGAIVACAHVASTVPFGVFGVMLLLALDSVQSVVFYAIGYAVAVTVGFASAWWLGFSEPDMEE